ncbi:WD40 repeat-like protein [Xylographa opegraphella]|nr:WD40 repeat-like protein [Xylographa opegraphella]
MSIKADGIWAAAPSTTRGQPTPLSSDASGERIAYANSKSIFLRSIDNSALSTQYTGHTNTTTVARFSPSGYYVASGDVAGTVRVWDCKGEGATKGEYSIISGRINDLAWDGDSQRIIAVGDGKERFGHCVTADSGNTVGEISGHSSQVNSVAIRQQRPLRAATGSDDTSLVFYHGAPFKFNTSLRGQHNRFVYGVAFSPDGSSLVSVGADRKIWLYDGKTGEVKSQIGDGEHKGSIFGVSWSKDSKRFVTSSADQTVKIWDVEAGKATQTWRLGEEGAVSIPDHQVGVVWPAGRSDGLIISLNLAGDLSYLTEGTSKVQRVVQGHQKNITSLAVVSDSITLWTGGSDGRICSWDTSTGAASTPDGSPHTNYVSGLAASSTTTMYSIGWDDTLRTLDTTAQTFTGEAQKTSGQPSAIAVAGSHTLVATHKGIDVFSNGQKTGSLPTTAAPTALAATPSLIAIAADDSTLSIHAFSPTGTLAPNPQHALPSPSSQPTSLAFSPSGALLAAGFSNGKITVYDTADWSVAVSRWSAHTSRVNCIRWNGSGSHAVSAGLDGSVFVWSVARPGMRVQAPGAHAGGVNAVGWVAEGGVVSVGGDACVKRWVVGGLV